jgi:hypothetical protein
METNTGRTSKENQGLVLCDAKTAQRTFPGLLCHLAPYRSCQETAPGEHRPVGKERYDCPSRVTVLQ